MSKRIQCPIARSVSLDQCSDCDYKEACLEDILNNFELKAMKLAGESIKEIREVIRKHEKSLG